MSEVAFTLNGEPIRYDGDQDRSLLSWLREDRGLTAAKDGCNGEGTCRACTVEIDGRAKLACLTAMGSLAGCAVTTVEGLPEPVRTVIAEAFVRYGACSAASAHRATSRARACSWRTTRSRRAKRS